MHKKTVLFWWIPILLVVGTSVMYAYSQTLFTVSYTHKLVVLNLKTEAVLANDKSLLLYDSATFEADPISKVTVGTESFQLQRVQGKSLIDVKVISDTPHCFFTADVTEYYTGNGDPEITRVYEETDNYVSVETNQSKYIYLYPGTYNLDLEEDNTVDREIIGIYPFECSTKDDIDSMKTIVEAYRLLIPERERDLIDRVSP
jgi:hypothetical protein